MLGGALFLLFSTSTILGASYLNDRFNPKQVVAYLWHLPLNQFNQSWHELVASYREQHVDLMRFSACIKFVRLCRIVHNFLIKVYVDTASNSLIYCERYAPIELDRTQVFPLLVYWKKQRLLAYQDFYALYFDCVSRLFVVALHEIHTRKEVQQADGFAKAEQYHAELQTILSVLVASEYEGQFARQAARYQSLLALARAECRQDGG